MARMKALRTFTDDATGRLVPEGSEFACDAGAVSVLVSQGVAEEVAPKGPRPTKAELLDEAEREMTNPELAEAIAAAKESPAKGRRARRKDQ